MPLKVTGMASKKTLLISDVTQSELSLLEYLQSKNFPIASSCQGDGVCLKCICFTSDKKEVISCQTPVKKLNDETLYFTYL